jgi:uncharacterized protein (DUF952 family)/8-oxo-dGTP pyrophosphatase MutT (NUDIX family)
VTGPGRGAGAAGGAPAGWPPIFHLALAADWSQAQEAGRYGAATRGVSVAEEGFVHASFAAQVASSAAAHFAPGDDLVLLAVDPARTGAEVRVEGGFPHVYGPLPVDAVVASRPYRPDAEGRWPEVTAARSSRVAAYALVRDGERLLITRLSERTGRPGAWTLPGGGIDHGEHPAATVRRETYEETGLEIDVGELLGVDSRHWVGWFGTHLEDHHGLRLVHRATARDRGAALRVLDVGGSTDAAAWVRVADLPEVETVDLVESALAMAAAG